MTGPRRPERLEVVHSHRDSSGVVLVLYGDLDAGTALRLEQAAAQLFAAEYPPEVLFLDLSGLSFLSVAGARAILAVHESAGTSRVRVVTGDRPAVREFLHVTRFDAVLDCYRTRAGAIAAGSRAEFVSHVQTIWDAG
ncbi:STAS domain-containing protein [Amycolatopsis sp. NPDC005003]